MAGDRSTLRICMVAHNAYGALAGSVRGHIGGVEWQTSLMAKQLVRRGFQVVVLVWGEGPAGDETTCDGVRIIKMCRQTEGLPGLRFFHPRWSSLTRALARADCDVYYHNSAECVTGQIALWCRRHGRRFVYSVASDMDCDVALPDLPGLRERVLYRLGLRRADRIIAQTRTQQAMLRTGFGRDSVVIPMPCAGPRSGEYVPVSPPAVGPPRVLWVGRIAPVKRVELLWDVAAAMPDVCFDVVGPLEPETVYTREQCRIAGDLPNVTLHGRIARERMPDLYRQASCLCCTSRFEGFPNTFLEAWSYGIPVVSTFDPDGLIAERGLGVAASDVAGLVRGIRGLLASPERWREAGDNARRYYSENHTVEAVLPRFEQVFREGLRSA